MNHIFKFINQIQPDGLPFFMYKWVFLRVEEQPLGTIERLNSFVYSRC